VTFGPGDALPLTGRLLAVDPGEVRVGLALTDPMQVVAQPHSVLPVGHPRDLTGIADDVAVVAHEQAVVGIVVGWPRDMTGRETGPGTRARRLSDAVRDATGLPVALWDERLTTVEAERLMISADASRAERKRKIDTVAAGIILRGVLDAHVVKRAAAADG
jgi:putative Holliday junction resolvase